MSEEKEKNQKLRGSGFPSINLFDAIETMKRALPGGFQASKETFAQAIGYSSVKNGAFLVKLAALRSYGLVTKGESAGFTQLAKELVVPGGTEEVIKQRLFDAFFNVHIFKSLYDKLAEIKNTDEASISRSGILEFGVAQNRGKEFARNFIDSGKYAGLLQEQSDGKITFVEIKEDSNQLHQDTEIENKNNDLLSFANKHVGKDTSVHEHVIKDGGNGWELYLKIVSNIPISTEIKKLVVDISEKIDQINSQNAN